MPQSSMKREEIIAALESLPAGAVYEGAQDTTIYKPVGKGYVDANGKKVPTRGSVVHVPPMHVTLTDFHDRRFGHTTGVTRDKDGAPQLGHVEELALQIHEQGQLEDCAGVLIPQGEGYGVQVWRGGGRTLATRALVLAGIAPDATLRVKIVDVIGAEGPDAEQLKALMTATVNANLQVAAYSPVDKAAIFAQMKDGSYNGLQWTQEEIAATLGVTPASVSQLLNINQMVPALQHLIHTDRLGYARALSLKLHKLPPEKQEEWANEFLAGGKAKGKHEKNGDAGEKPATPKQIVTALITWCDDVINSTAHKQGSKAIARELRDALTSAAGPNVGRLDDVVEENTRATAARAGK